MGNLNKTISYPLGNADVKAQVPYAADLSIEISNQETIVPISQLTGAAQLDLVIDQDVRAGANLFITIGADTSNRTLTPGNNMTGTAQALLANKNYVLCYKYDGTNFIHESTICTNGSYSIETATDVQAKAYASVIAATIAAKNTQITIAQMTGDATLNLTVGGGVAVGAKLIVFVSSDSHSGGRVLTLGTAMSGPASTIAASKSFAIQFEYDGTNFVQTAAAIQLN